MNPILAVIASLIFAASSAVDKPDPIDPAPRSLQIVATVNGEPIYLTDLERRLGQIHGEASEGERGVFDIETLLFKMSNDILLGQEARAMEMHLEPPTNDQIRLFYEKLLLNTLDRDEILLPSTPSEEEVARRYEDTHTHADTHTHRRAHTHTTRR